MQEDPWWAHFRKTNIKTERSLTKCMLTRFLGECPWGKWNKMSFLCSQKKNKIFKRIKKSTVQGGGSVLLWGCFAVAGTGWLKTLQGTVKSKDYQDILKRNVWVRGQKTLFQLQLTAPLKGYWPKTCIHKYPRMDERTTLRLSECALNLIQLHISGKSWNCQLGEDTHQTWKNWRSLLKKSYLPTEKRRSLIRSYKNH